jgi:hypothetical protein
LHHVIPYSRGVPLLLESATGTFESRDWGQAELRILP